MPTSDNIHPIFLSGELIEAQAARFKRFEGEWRLPFDEVAGPQGHYQEALATLLALNIAVIGRVLVSPGRRELSMPYVELFSAITGKLFNAKLHAMAAMQFLRSLTLDGPSEAEPFAALFQMLSDCAEADVRYPVSNCAKLFDSLLEDACEMSRDPLDREKLQVLKEVLVLEAKVHSPLHDRAFADACQKIGVTRVFTNEDLKAAYRDRAREWHPDRLEGMAPELRELANSKLAEINEAYELLQAQSQVRGKQPQPRSEASRSREELLVRLERYRDNNVPVTDDFHERDLSESDGEDEPNEADYEEGIGDSYVDRHPVGAALFVLFVLVLVGLYGWGMWLGRDHPAASTQATTTAGTPTPADIAPRSEVEGGPTTPDGSVEQPSTMPTAEHTGNTSLSTIRTVEVLAEAQRWASDMTTNDPDRMSSHYTEEVERYYLQKGITRADVRASMADWLAHGNRNDRFDIRDPTVRFVSDEMAIVNLTANAKIETRSGVHDLTSRSELTFVRTGGGWQLTGKRDFLR